MAWEWLRMDVTLYARGKAGFHCLAVQHCAALCSRRPVATHTEVVEMADCLEWAFFFTINKNSKLGKLEVFKLEMQASCVNFKMLLDFDLRRYFLLGLVKLTNLQE